MHSLIDTEYLLTSSDRKLFRNMQKCERCLNHLLPPRKNNIIDPRAMSSCCLFAIMSYIGVPLLFAVFSTFQLFNMHVYFICYTVMFISNFNHMRLSLDNKRLRTYLLTPVELCLQATVSILGDFRGCAIKY